MTEIIWTASLFVVKQFNYFVRSFSTHSFQDLSCKSDNVVYAIECTLCGLIYVGETKEELRKRMNGLQSQINNGGNQLLY